MESIKELLIKKYAELIGYDPGEEEWEPRITNMLEIAGQGRYTRDDIVTITDTGLGSNGGAGILFTTDAICVKDWGNSTKRFIARFQDIEYCLMEEESFLGMDFTKLELHMKSDEVFKLSTTLHGTNLDQMQELIEYAMELHDQAEDEAWMAENGIKPETQPDPSDEMDDANEPETQSAHTDEMDEAREPDELDMSAQSPSEIVDNLAN